MFQPSAGVRKLTPSPVSKTPSETRARRPSSSISGLTNGVHQSPTPWTGICRVVTGGRGERYSLRKISSTLELNAALMSTISACAMASGEMSSRPIAVI